MPVAFQTAMRAAAVDLLRDFADEMVGDPPAKRLKLQVYAGRPRTIIPPTAFVDGIRESIEYTGPTLHQRTPTVDVIVLHGIWDTADTADQKDAFVDDFLGWCLTRYHAAGGNTLLAIVETEDLPDYVPEWLPPEQQRTYYATRIALEGFAGSA